jgi:hypothetical protein
VIAAAASPSEPAAPPPPEVSAAAGGERRGETNLGHAENRCDLRGIARAGVDREAVEVLDRQPGIVERGQDRLARQLELGLG